MPGLYQIVIDNQIKYVGRANNLRRRYDEHLDEKTNLELRLIMNEARELCFEYSIVFDKLQLAKLESQYILSNLETVFGINKKIPPKEK